ncbi:MAG: M20/M25/M40 family metallo-hydrolase [Gaiellaceae bacterium]
MTGAPPDLRPLLLELGASPSPPGHERGVAERVTDYVGALGLVSVEDDAGSRIGGNTGNILVRIEPTVAVGTPIFLCAHLDTVQPEAELRPVVEEGYVRNAADTILGADNKAAVAVMLDAVRTVLAQERSQAGIELLFTPREETGCDGAKAFDTSALTAKIGFVFDHAAPIGDIVQTAPFQTTLDATFTGRKAHAGIAPEEGRSAIAAAARAVSELRLGRIDEQTTSNVGLISGGTARNIVPDRCELTAEARSLDETTLRKLVGEMVDSIGFAASVAECEVEIAMEDKYSGYRFAPDDALVELGERALRQAGYEPQLVDCGGGADANVFNLVGVPCLNLANGMAKIHSPDEEIAVADLEGMREVTLALIDAAATTQVNV